MTDKILHFMAGAFMRPSPQLEYLMKFDGTDKNIEILERSM